MQSEANALKREIWAQHQGSRVLLRSKIVPPDGWDNLLGQLIGPAASQQLFFFYNQREIKISGGRGVRFSELIVRVDLGVLWFQPPDYPPE
jgi:hypothetical protein